MAGRIAIDFGTERTKVAYLPAPGRAPELLRFMHEDSERSFIPSLFYLPKESDQILFGHDAEAMQEEDPVGVIDDLKRRLHETRRRANGREATPRAMLAQLFGYLREQARENVAAFDGEGPDEVVFTVPPGFGPAQRDVVRQAALDAGFEAVVDMIDEPVAAARAWLADSGDHVDHIVVLDCGGGTVDWAYLRRDETGAIRVAANCPPGGMDRLGGRDVDEGLVELVERKLAEAGEDSIEFGVTRRARLRARMRRTKESMTRGSQPNFTVRVGDRAITLDRSEIEAVALDQFIERATDGLSAYINRISAAFPKQNVPRVLIVGGSGRLAGLKDAMAKLGYVVAAWDRADFAPALGALRSPDGSKGTGPNCDHVNAEFLGVESIESNEWLDRGGEYSDDTDLISAGEFYRQSAQHGNVIDFLRLATLDEVAHLLNLDEENAIKPFQSLMVNWSQNNNHWSQLCLGDWHSFGWGNIEENDDQASFWWERSIGGGNAYAMYKIANDICSVYGDKNRKLRLLRTAHKHGILAATLALSSEVKGTERLELLEKAAEGGDDSACVSLGEIYLKGDKSVGATKNVALAKKWFQRAGHYGSAMYELWWIDHPAPDWNSQKELLLEAADEGDMYAAYLVGSALMGMGCYFKKDESRGLELLRQSADSGFAPAQEKLAVAYARGKAGLDRSLPNAITWLIRSVENGNKSAEFLLGLCYLKLGRPLDRVEGIGWLRSAAQNGDQEAKFGLGVALLHGIGAAVQTHEALQLFKQVHHKHRDASIILGLMENIDISILISDVTPVFSSGWS